METIAIDFLLKNAESLRKWFGQKFADVSLENSNEISAKIIQADDHEILLKAVELLKNNFDKFSVSFGKETKLLETYENAQFGLAAIRVKKLNKIK